MCNLTNNKVLDKTQVISHIKQVAERVLPKGSTLYLYGSRARGDYHKESDWDLLVLLDKAKRSHDDWDNYAWPFTQMGWDINEDISARTFTKDQWYNGPHTMFYYNVEEDKQLLYES
ncbi:MAG: nucleotidyltransferase domain-containing protein [Prevotella sp.]|nr:nucleotidyltransferase domain-containing protein [Prevotella sp.]